jgi:hypothetical protein
LNHASPRAQIYSSARSPDTTAKFESEATFVESIEATLSAEGCLRMMPRAAKTGAAAAISLSAAASSGFRNRSGARPTKRSKQADGGAPSGAGEVAPTQPARPVRGKAVMTVASLTATASIAQQHLALLMNSYQQMSSLSTGEGVASPEQAAAVSFFRSGAGWQEFLSSWER